MGFGCSKLILCSMKSSQRQRYIEFLLIHYIELLLNEVEVWEGEWMVGVADWGCWWGVGMYIGFILSVHPFVSVYRQHCVCSVAFRMLWLHGLCGLHGPGCPLAKKSLWNYSLIHTVTSLVCEGFIKYLLRMPCMHVFHKKQRNEFSTNFCNSHL